MRIPRIYTPQELVPGRELTLDPRAAHYIYNVLRLDADRLVLLFNGDGRAFDAMITHAGKKGVNVSVLTESTGREMESPLRIHLGIAISKGERMDWVMQKATELGVARITPLFTQRVEVRLDDKRQAKKHEHWLQVIVSACEQCGRSRLPQLDAAQKLPEWLGVADAERKFVLSPAGAPTPAAEPRPQSVALLVGPEGGLDEPEIVLAADSGFTPLQLGPRVLRTETAPLAAIAVLQHQWGDM